MPKARVGDLNMYYEIIGDGVPVVFISGITLDHLPWKAFQVPTFTAAGYKCFIFDNRDAGQTGDSPLESYSIKQFARDTADLTAQLGFNSFHLVGYSMGGAIAQELTLSHPERIRSLTLVATTPKPDAYGAALISTLKPAKLKLSREEFLRTLGLRVFTHRFFENPEAVRAWMERAMGNPYPQSAPALVRQADAILGHDVVDRLHQIKTPTHIIVGDEDILVPPRHSQKLVALIPGAKLTVIPESAHGVTTETAAAFNKVVLEFLAQCQ